MLDSFLYQSYECNNSRALTACPNSACLWLVVRSARDVIGQKSVLSVAHRSCIVWHTWRSFSTPGCYLLIENWPGSHISTSLHRQSLASFDKSGGTGSPQINQRCLRGTTLTWRGCNQWQKSGKPRALATDSSWRPARQIYYTMLIECSFPARLNPNIASIITGEPSKLQGTNRRAFYNSQT